MKPGGRSARYEPVAAGSGGFGRRRRCQVGYGSGRHCSRRRRRYGSDERRRRSGAGVEAERCLRHPRREIDPALSSLIRIHLNKLVGFVIRDPKGDLIMILIEITDGFDRRKGSFLPMEGKNSAFSLGGK